MALQTGAKSSRGQWHSGSSRKRCRSTHGSSSWKVVLHAGITERPFARLKSGLSPEASRVDQGLTKLLHAEFDHSIKSRKNGILSFSATIAGELDWVIFESMDNHIYLSRIKAFTRIGQSKGEDIRKQMIRQGCQLMISLCLPLVRFGESRFICGWI